MTPLLGVISFGGFVLKWWRGLAAILRFLDQVTPWEFVRVIKDRDTNSDYLIRHYVCNTRWMDWLGTRIHPWFHNLSYRVTLHRTLRSDFADALHDHPWDWGSHLLEGGYLEHTPEGQFWREPSQGWRWRKAEDFHRLELVPERNPGQTWSLFVMGPRKKEWGFQTKLGWAAWWDFLNNRETYR